MTQITCAHPGCDQPKGKRRGYCAMHYYRWMKHLDMDAPKKGSITECSVDGCTGKLKSNRLCSTHIQRLVRRGSVDVVLRPGHKAGTRWSTTRVSYRSMHKRMDRVFGTASQHSCVDCDGSAAQWSYTGDDPHERVGENGCAFSVWPEYYTPRCVPCHKRLDLARAMYLHVSPSISGVS